MRTTIAYMPRNNRTSTARIRLTDHAHKPPFPASQRPVSGPGSAFFNEIISHPVPIDMNTLTALKRSSLGLDLYLWLVYRTFPLRAPQRITWRQIYRQFGVDPAKASDHRTVQDFRHEVLRELKEIKLAWLELNYSTAPGVLILHPSIPFRHSLFEAPFNILFDEFSICFPALPNVDRYGMSETTRAQTLPSLEASA